MPDLAGFSMTAGWDGSSTVRGALGPLFRSLHGKLGSPFDLGGGSCA